MQAKIKQILSVVFIIIVAVFVIRFVFKCGHENTVLREVIRRLEADSRIAEALVTAVNYDDLTNKIYTTIKFLEYDVNRKPLPPRYFSFSGNIIQFQSLVIRFDDIHVIRGDKLRSKSVYLFWKIFMLDGPNTQEYEITKINEIPEGYKVGGKEDIFEEKLWKKFWKYALDRKASEKVGIKNCQIEAPGTMFIPGILYTIKIEHDGGMRIDASPLPSILKGEKIPE